MDALQIEFIEAVAMSKMEEMEGLLKRGIDVNWKDGSFRNGLDYCVSLSPVYNDVDTLDRDAEGYLYKVKRLHKAQIILKHGAKTNIMDKFGWTILHQCARNGDLPLLQLCVRKGCDVHTRNHSNQLPIDLAATQGHTHVVRYLDVQTGDLKSMCRVAIRDAMGKRSYNRLDELPLPPTIKLFLNYFIPYTGWKATIIPPQPWTSEQLLENKVDQNELKEFISENASHDFIEENKDILQGNKCEVSELAQTFQSMYLWEAFKDIDYQEPLARKPRYSMEPVKKKEDKTVGAVSELKRWLMGHHF